jgi:hypothetical protein
MVVVYCNTYFIPFLKAKIFDGRRLVSTGFGFKTKRVNQPPWNGVIITIIIGLLWAIELGMALS